MKINPYEVIQQKLLIEISHVEKRIEEYKNKKGCLYMLLSLDKTYLCELQDRLKKLRYEYEKLT